MRPTARLGLNTLALLMLGIAVVSCAQPSFQRNTVSFRRGPYNFAFYDRHNEAYRFSAAIHIAHGKAHDVLELTPLSEAVRWDRAFDGEMSHAAFSPPRIEPHMMDWGPHVGQAIWPLYRAIDWTHIHHEQTYDILSSSDVPWHEKQAATDRAVRYYLHKDNLARSPAPLDVTMRRAGVMMKPYMGYFRNHYPRSNDYFYVAHWWHPVIYEAMMIAGNDAEQDDAVRATHALLGEVFDERPQRMLLSRETMPRYSRMSPESANIFDNLHMLHGIAYDILAYEGWTIAQKRKELIRVIKAMSYQPGDEAHARQFDLPYPDMDPRRYEDWMKGYDGSMNRMMEEMLAEMWPMMSPDGSATVPPDVLEQTRKKLTPGLQPGELPGSLHEAIMRLVPRMKMDPKSQKPGVTPKKMVDAMLRAWAGKHAGTAGAPAISMAEDPALPVL